MTHQDSSANNETSGRFRDQPRAVWAVAFAAVVSFMGIGLVDPILPIIADSMHAGPDQVSMLFTSYMLVTGLAMLITGWFSSRLGAKRTLLIGLAFIVFFALCSGLSGTVNQIIGFRAGWGIGNALFIATALATIVGAASGGVPRAVMMYEAAMGLGMAMGPLIGGLLGRTSWRGPFFGTASLMAVAFILVIVLLPTSPKPPRKIGLLEPFRSLHHRGLFRLSLTAFLYNMGFFVLLSQSPYPMESMGTIGIGLVFFAWGVLLAMGSVILVAPLQKRFGRLKVLTVDIVLLAIDLFAMSTLSYHLPVFCTCVVVGGLLLGIANTLLTESVMEVSDVESSIASAGYSSVRFTGGAIATFVAGKLTTAFGVHSSYWYGAAALACSALVLVLSWKALAHVDGRIVKAMDTAELDPVAHAQALTGADA